MKELVLYKEKLQTKPAVNTMDFLESKINVLMNQLQNPTDFLHLFAKTKKDPREDCGLQHVSTSVISREGIEELKNCIRKSLPSFAIRIFLSFL